LKRGSRARDRPHLVWSLDRITLTHAVARIAHGDVIGGRYNVHDGKYLTEAEARTLRAWDLMQPSGSGLPGTDVLRSIAPGLESSDEAWETALADGKARRAVWEAADAETWRAAARMLHVALVEGEIAVDKTVPPVFWLRHDLSSREIDDFFLSAPAFERWLRGYRGEASIRSKGAARLPPFDARKATAHLAAKKVNSDWVSCPGEKETREFLKMFFNGVPNEPHRSIRHKLWPNQIKRGRPKRRTAE
jgi:hypothetical protein